MNDLEIKRRLVELYQATSKHSNYQALPSLLQKEIGDKIEAKTRHEKERLDYIASALDVAGKSILDIGGNSGYFTLELASMGARLHYYEGNKAHAEFVALAALYLGIPSDRLNATNAYYSFDGLQGDSYDVALLLNVLHHVGDDFGDKAITIEKARDAIIGALRRLSKIASFLVFQMGFNWKGDSRYCLFREGTKREMIDFVLKGTAGFYDVRKIGVPEKRTDGAIFYCDLNDRNIERDDSLGEFLNRPLFILKSKGRL